jgi:hypothetical protein
MSSEDVIVAELNRPLRPKRTTYAIPRFWVFAIFFAFLFASAFGAVRTEDGEEIRVPEHTKIALEHGFNPLSHEWTNRASRHYERHPPVESSTTNTRVQSSDFIVPQWANVEFPWEEALDKSQITRVTPVTEEKTIPNVPSASVPKPSDQEIGIYALYVTAVILFTFMIVTCVLVQLCRSRRVIQVRIPGTTTVERNVRFGEDGFVIQVDVEDLIRQANGNPKVDIIPVVDPTQGFWWQFARFSKHGAYNVPRGEGGVGIEAMMSQSTITKTEMYPECLMEVIAMHKDGKASVVGMAWRGKLGEYDLCFTAAHVAMAGVDQTLWLSRPGAAGGVSKAIRLPVNRPCVARSDPLAIGGYDFLAFSLSQKEWSLLGVRPAKINSTCPSSATISLYGRGKHGLNVTHGIALSRDDLRYVYNHSASSFPSWSGSPLFYGGEVLAMHTGWVDHDGEMTNVAVHLGVILASLNIVGAWDKVGMNPKGLMSTKSLVINKTLDVEETGVQLLQEQSRVGVEYSDEAMRRRDDYARRLQSERYWRDLEYEFDEEEGEIDEQMDDLENELDEMDAKYGDLIDKHDPDSKAKDRERKKDEKKKDEMENKHSRLAQARRNLEKRKAVFRDAFQASVSDKRLPNAAVSHFGTAITFTPFSLPTRSAERCVEFSTPVGNFYVSLGYGSKNDMKKIQKLTTGLDELEPEGVEDLRARQAQTTVQQFSKELMHRFVNKKSSRLATDLGRVASVESKTTPYAVYQGETKDLARLQAVEQSCPGCKSPTFLVKGVFVLCPPCSTAFVEMRKGLEPKLSAKQMALFSTHDPHILYRIEVPTWTGFDEAERTFVFYMKKPFQGTWLWNGPIPNMSEDQVPAPILPKPKQKALEVQVVSELDVPQTILSPVEQKKEQLKAELAKTGVTDRRVDSAAEVAAMKKKELKKLQHETWWQDFDTVTFPILLSHVFAKEKFPTDAFFKTSWLGLHRKEPLLTTCRMEIANNVIELQEGDGLDMTTVSMPADKLIKAAMEPNSATKQLGTFKLMVAMGLGQDDWLEQAVLTHNSWRHTLARERADKARADAEKATKIAIESAVNAALDAREKKASEEQVFPKSAPMKDGKEALNISKPSASTSGPMPLPKAKSDSNGNTPVGPAPDITKAMRRKRAKELKKQKKASQNSTNGSGPQETPKQKDDLSNSKRVDGKVGMESGEMLGKLSKRESSPILNRVEEELFQQFMKETKPPSDEVLASKMRLDIDTMMKSLTDEGRQMMKEEILRGVVHARVLALREPQPTNHQRKSSA